MATARETYVDLLKKLQHTDPEFVDSVLGLSKEELDRNMSLYSKHHEEVVLAQAADEILEQAELNVKELKAPYKESIRAIKKKLKFINLLIKEKSGSLDDQSERIEE